MKTEINALEVLAKMEDFRQKHQDENQYSANRCMRRMEDIVAKEAGYESRTDWTDELKKRSKDDRDEKIEQLEAEVQRLRNFIRKTAINADNIARDMELCLADALAHRRN